MRIGIDASYLLTPQKSGVEMYTLNLVRALLRLEERPRLYLYGAGPSPGPDTEGLWRAAGRTRLSARTRLWLRMRIPALMGLDRIGVAHFPGGLLPTTVPAPSVITFYDFAALAYPELYDPRERSYYDTIIPRSAQRASAVIAISERTKADAVRAFGLDEDKVVVTPLGVDPQFRPVPDAAQLVRDRYGVGPGYILGCVGSGHPRKNLKAVVSAFELMPGAGVDLVIVGSVQRDQEACALIEASPRRERIHALGYVPETDLPAIYSAAGALCFPSLFEGFGLPVLEAMACGTPVVCSAAGALGEVAGDAAMVVEPENRPRIAEALECVLTDERARSDLAQRGLAQARRYTWDRTARLTLEAYHRAAGERGAVPTAW